MESIKSKLGVSGTAGSVAIVLTWVAGLWGINIPPEVAAAIATLMHSLIGLAVTK